MGFFRQFSSRRVLAVATAGLSVASLGGACMAQDDGGAVSQPPYHGRYLDWSGKKPAPVAQDDAADLSEARFAPNADYTPGDAGPQRPRPEPASYAPSRYEGASDDAPRSRFGSSSDDPPPSRYAQPASQAPDDDVSGQRAATPSSADDYSPAARDAPARATAEAAPTLPRYAAPPASQTTDDTSAGGGSSASDAYYPPPRAPDEAARPARSIPASRYARPSEDASASQPAQPAEATPATPAAARLAASRPAEASVGQADDGLAQAQADAPALFPPPPAPTAAEAAAAPTTPTPIFRHSPQGQAAAPASAVAPIQPAPSPPPSAASYAPPPSAAPAPERADGGSSVRFYSLHREYGMTPDPIPEPTEGHTVLIGPPDQGAGAQKPDQADQDQGGVGGEDKPPAAKPDAAPSGDK